LLKILHQTNYFNDELQFNKLIELSTINQQNIVKFVKDTTIVNISLKIQLIEFLQLFKENKHFDCLIQIKHLLKAIHLKFPFKDFIDSSNWFYYFNENWDLIKLKKDSIHVSVSNSSLFIASDVSDILHIPDDVDCFYDEQTEEYFMNHIKPVSFKE
jgi:hypothetical protein